MYSINPTSMKGGASSHPPHYEAVRLGPTPRSAASAGDSPGFFTSLWDSAIEVVSPSTEKKKKEDTGVEVKRAQALIEELRTDLTNEQTWEKIIALVNTTKERLFSNSAQSESEKDDACAKLQWTMWHLFNKSCELLVHDGNGFQETILANTAVSHFLLSYPPTYWSYQHGFTEGSLKAIYKMHNIFLVKKHLIPKMPISLEHSELEFSSCRLFLPEITVGDPKNGGGFSEQFEHWGSLSQQFLLSEFKSELTDIAGSAYVKKIDTGGDPRLCSKYLIRFLHELGRREQQYSFACKWKTCAYRIHKGLYLTDAFCKASDEIEKEQTDSNIFKKKYLRLLANMQVGHGVAFHGGYRPEETESGHGVIYEIERQNQLFYSLKKVNTGEGIHQGFFLKAQDRGLAVQLFENISFETITSDALIGVFLNFKNRHSKKASNGAKESKTKHIEESLEKVLRTTARRVFEVPIQTTDTCAISPTLCWIKYSIQDDALAQQLQEVVLKGIIENLLAIQVNSNVDSLRTRSLTHATTTTTTTTVSPPQANTFEQELSDLIAVATAVYGRVIQANTIQLELQIKTAPPQNHGNWWF